MDMSVVEGEEKPVNVNEVPEYAAEIHTYLREMEVRDLREQQMLLCLHFTRGCSAVPSFPILDIWKISSELACTWFLTVLPPNR